MADTPRWRVFVYAHDPESGGVYFLDMETVNDSDNGDAREDALEELWPDALWEGGWEPITVTAHATDEEADALVTRYEQMTEGALYRAEIGARRNDVELVLGDIGLFARSPTEAAELAHQGYQASEVWPDAHTTARLYTLTEAIELTEVEARQVLENEQAVTHSE